MNQGARQSGLISCEGELGELEGVESAGSSEEAEDEEVSTVGSPRNYLYTSWRNAKLLEVSVILRNLSIFLFTFV